MVVAFNYNTYTKPVLEITDNQADQVVIRFIPYRPDEHLTIHLNKDGTFVRTHRSQNKEKSVWDDLRVEAAAASGIPDPDRHGTYIINTPLPKIDNVTGYYLGGRLIDLSSFTPRAWYMNHIDLRIPVPSLKFMLKLYLSTTDNPAFHFLERVTTTLGDICFEFEQR